MAESWQPLYKRKPVLCDTANVNNMTTPIIELSDDTQMSKGLWHYIQGDTNYGSSGIAAYHHWGGVGVAQSNALRIGMIGVKVLTKTTCRRVADGGVWVQTEGEEEKLLPADSVILSAGMRPRTSMVEELQSANELLL